MRTTGYEYGTLGNGLRARRHRRSGLVEFVLWKAGEQGHEEDYWHRAGDGHEFIPEMRTKEK